MLPSQEASARITSCQHLNRQTPTLPSFGYRILSFFVIVWTVLLGNIHCANVKMSYSFIIMILTLVSNIAGVNSIITQSTPNMCFFANYDF